MSLRLRRGGITEPPPPPSEIYGPVAGHQTIRDNAGPKSVTSPGGGISFNSASNIQTLINSNAANTLFVASATGAYANFRGLSYGTKHPRFYFPGLASSYSITGTAATTLGMDGSQGLEVHGGTWSGYGTTASPIFSAPINVVGPSVIEDAVFTLNGRKGLGISDDAGSTYVVRRCAFTSNGHHGITGNGASLAVPDITMDSCFVSQNNTGLFACGVTCVTKFSSGCTGTFKNNHFIADFGFGLWFDGANVNCNIHDNVIEDSDQFFYEVSYGGMIFEHNYVRDNVPGSSANIPFNGVMVIISNDPCDGSQGGPNVTSEIRYNDIIAPAGRNHPIVLFDHGEHPPLQLCRNWYVHHNRMFMPMASGLCGVGIVDACSPTSTNGPLKVGKIGARADLLFDFNEYHVADVNGTYWRHDTGYLTPGYRDWVGFRSRGHEAHGTLVQI